MLNFYSSPFSPFATKVQYFLEEAGIPYTYHAVNMRTPAGRTTIDAKSPFGKVPSIELNGFCLGESNAILRYLAARYEKFSFYPLNLEERAQVDMCADFAQLHVGTQMMRLAWNLHFAPKLGMGAPDEKAVADARADLARGLPRLDAALGGRAFLTGADLTLADVILLPFAADYKNAQVSLSDFPHVLGWVSRMTERSAWKKTHADQERRMAEAMRA